MNDMQSMASKPPVNPTPHGDAMTINRLDGGVGQRMSARQVLLARATNLRRVAEALESLASQIPDGWPHSADEALRNLIHDSRL